MGGFGSFGIVVVWPWFVRGELLNFGCTHSIAWTTLLSTGTLQFSARVSLNPYLQRECSFRALLHLQTTPLIQAITAAHLPKQESESSISTRTRTTAATPLPSQSPNFSNGLTYEAAPRSRLAHPNTYPPSDHGSPHSPILSGMTHAYGTQ